MSRARGTARVGCEREQDGRKKGEDPRTRDHQVLELDDGRRQLRSARPSRALKRRARERNWQRKRRNAKSPLYPLHPRYFGRDPLTCASSRRRRDTDLVEGERQRTGPKRSLARSRTSRTSRRASPVRYRRGSGGGGSGNSGGGGGGVAAVVIVVVVEVFGAVPPPPHTRRRLRIVATASSGSRRHRRWTRLDSAPSRSCPRMRGTFRARIRE